MELQERRRSYIAPAIIAFIGYILSPLSWWNDLFVNVPIAYLFAFPFTLISETLYLPAFVVGYWLSNLAGFLLIHHAGESLLRKRGHKNSWRKSVVITLVYTLLIMALVICGVLPPLDQVISGIKQGVINPC